MLGRCASIVSRAFGAPLPSRAAGEAVRRRLGDAGVGDDLVADLDRVAGAHVAPEGFEAFGTLDRGDDLIVGSDRCGEREAGVLREAFIRDGSHPAVVNLDAARQRVHADLEAGGVELVGHLFHTCEAMREQAGIGFVVAKSAPPGAEVDLREPAATSHCNPLVHVALGDGSEQVGAAVLLRVHRERPSEGRVGQTLGPNDFLEHFSHLTCRAAGQCDLGPRQTVAPHALRRECRARSRRSGQLPPGG